MQLVCRSPCLSKLFTHIPATAAAAPLICTFPPGILRYRVYSHCVNNANRRECRPLAAFATSTATGSARSATAAAALPVVYHPLYSAPQLAPGHRFPMQVFGRIYERLLQQDIVTPSQVCGSQCEVLRDLQGRPTAMAIAAEPCAHSTCVYYHDIQRSP